MKTKRRKLVGNYSNVARQRAAAMETKTSYLQIRIGINSSAYHSGTINSIAHAKEVIKKEYRERNVGDGYDSYWQTVPLIIERVDTTTTEIERI